MKRSKTKILSQILQKLDGGDYRKTQIVYALMLNYSRAEDHLVELETKGYLTYDTHDRYYRITPAGRELAGLLKHVEEMLK